jgi:serine phosphatase RsbU (regulator of sigma subunit)
MKMKALFNKITNSGVGPDLKPEVAEKTKLVNTISFLGVPICLFYTAFFAITSHYFHATVFFVGILIFIMPPLLNLWKGTTISVPAFTVATPVFWAFLTITAGKETGFYLGFIIFCIGPMLFFTTLRESLFYVWIGIILFFVSIIGLALFPPADTFPFAMWIFMINLFTVLITIVVVVYLFKKESDESRMKIKEKNREILDSINYAKRIQNAILPSESLLKSKLKDYFIFYSPKDIVAGDFYFMEEIDGKLLLAAADCTGHGVPGALVSLVCYNALNKAVVENKQTDPAKILDMTKKYVAEHFSKNNENVKDGMDITIISLNYKTKEISWAGANNPLWYVQNGELKIMRPDKQPVGYTEITNPFSSHTAQLAANDCFYLFTDGLADQFGGTRGKKFMYKPFKELLLSHADLPMFEQSRVIQNTLKNWKGNLEQVDDILVIGVRV